MASPAPAITPGTSVTFSLSQFIGMLAAVVAGVIGPVMWAQSQVNSLRTDEMKDIAALRADTASKADFAELKGQIAALTTSVNDLKVEVRGLTVQLEGVTKALDDLKVPKH